MNVRAARGLRKSYGATEVVGGVDLAVPAGECFGLLGPNGAGKTTTLKLCLGLIRPGAGEIELLGEPVPRRAREARVRVGVVPQFDNLDPDFTVAENLLVYGRYFGLPAAAVAARIPALLEFAGLAGRGDAKINTLSGGMKRRLTLARALVNDPQLLFLDEPTTGLDPQARHLIWERLRRLTQEGKTLVLTTHFMEEAERLCDRVALIDSGRVVVVDTPAGLTERVEIEQRIQFRPSAPLDDRLLTDLPDVTGVARQGDLVVVTGTANALNAVTSVLARNQIVARQLRVEQASLEDAFVALTGRHTDQA
jgi:lipooligosaccharide transport system ATP-binding protein